MERWQAHGVNDKRYIKRKRWRGINRLDWRGGEVNKEQEEVAEKGKGEGGKGRSERGRSLLGMEQDGVQPLGVRLREREEGGVSRERCTTRRHKGEERSEGGEGVPIQTKSPSSSSGL